MKLKFAHFKLSLARFFRFLCFLLELVCFFPFCSFFFNFFFGKPHFVSPDGSVKSSYSIVYTVADVVDLFALWQVDGREFFVAIEKFFDFVRRFFSEIADSWNVMLKKKLEKTRGKEGLGYKYLDI